jgi:adenylate kinase family enzyme
VEHYRSKRLLVEVHAERAIDEVRAEVQQALAAAGQR